MAKKRRQKAVKVGNPFKARTSLAWKNFTLFLALFVASLVLYKFSSAELFVNFFGILAAILGFVAFAFLIVLIVLVLIKPRRG